MPLAMNREDVNKYCQEHFNAISMLSNGTDDYISARCLLINGLFTGLSIAAQSVEKYFKGYLLILNPNANARKFSHKITDLKKEIQKYDDFGLDKYNLFLKRLEKHYLTRYPDNKDQSTYQSSDEYKELDELIIDLNEKLPIPDEVKYRSTCAIYINLFIPIERKIPLDVLPNSRWLYSNNEALQPLINDIIKKCKEVKEHLYPMRNKD